MNGKSMFRRTIGAVAAIFAMAALSPVATAHAEGYGSSHSLATTTSPTAAFISRAALPPLGSCSLRVLCLSHSLDGTFTAYSTIDVGPTPYYISIFNITTRQRLALCGFGTTCTTGPGMGAPVNTIYNYTAFIGSTSLTIPPNPVQSTSNTDTIIGSRLN